MAITLKYDDPISNSIASLTITPNNKRNLDRTVGGQGTVSGTVLFDASYPTGGYGVVNKFGLSSVAGVIFEEPNGYSIYYNKATDKIQVYSTAATEVANATNLSTLPAVYFEAKGLV